MLKVKKFMVFLLVLLVMVGVFPGTGSSVEAASHKTYGATLERGIKHLCYTKDTVYWKANGKKISKYSTNQKRSGVAVQNKGIKKYGALSTKKKYALLCKHTFLVGAVVKGVTLGWATDVNDMLYIKANGDCNVKWDF